MVGSKVAGIVALAALLLVACDDEATEQAGTSTVTGGSTTPSGGGGGTATGGGGAGGGAGGGSGGTEPAERGASPDWPIELDTGATLVYLEDYEQGSCDRIQSDSSAAVVSAADGADVFAGTYCLRGNFDPDTVDPITGRQGVSRYAGLSDIGLSSVGLTDRMYVSYRWRLDADVQFVPESGNFGGQKHAYITGSASPWAEKVNYVVGQAWGPDHWWVVNNSPNSLAISYQDNANVDSAAAALGTWHRVEFYLRLESSPGAADGIAILKIDEALAIDARDVPYLWPGAADQTWGGMALPSMFGGGVDPAASFGWQLDELEIWDGLPPPPG
ncbi:MAG: hypothetical protein JRI23_23280 [Deltaproteobacteria bacterium]|jgi:hypothetical protein|nr:hypothetical protein [Deltaproteobacteria bacterium]MBW2534896.1 hypothetical protein [Deltaproteobacteria bacterium]